jgi:2,3-diketo-5-methylthio-1-phosphopentane phosphatase
MGSVAAPVVFIDFDNTITRGDVLDRVIERFSPSKDWSRWEEEWQAGRMTTVECLERQVEGLKVSREELTAFMSTVELDSGFAPLVRWARRHGVEIRILSDNFAPLIAPILRRHRLGDVPFFANDLAFGDASVQAGFPYRDPGCPRCAHCKATHLRAAKGRTRVFIGDGLSDVCPALVADLVFAKDSLAAELARRSTAFEPFASLSDVIPVLAARIGSPLAA